MPINMSALAFGSAFLSLAVMTGANASSIVVMSNSTSTPSVVSFDVPAPVKGAETKPAANETASTPSVAAAGEPIPNVTDEKVSAIPAKPKHGPASTLMVIRGGITGDAFAPPSSDMSAATPAATPAAVTAEESAQARAAAKAAQPFVPAKASTPLGTTTLK